MSNTKQEQSLIRLKRIIKYFIRDSLVVVIDDRFLELYKDNLNIDLTKICAYFHQGFNREITTMNNTYARMKYYNVSHMRHDQQFMHLVQRLETLRQDCLEANLKITLTAYLELIDIYKKISQPSADTLPLEISKVQPIYYDPIIQIVGENEITREYIKPDLQEEASIKSQLAPENAKISSSKVKEFINDCEDEFTNEKYENVFRDAHNALDQCICDIHQQNHEEELPKYDDNDFNKKMKSFLEQNFDDADDKVVKALKTIVNNLLYLRNNLSKAHPPKLRKATHFEARTYLNISISLIDYFYSYHQDNQQK